MPPQLSEKITILVTKTKKYNDSNPTPPPLTQQEDDPSTPSVHLLEDRSSSHLRKNQMKIVDSRTVIFDEPEIQQQREKVVVEIQLDLDQLIGKPGLVLERTRGTTLLLVHTIRKEGWFPSTALQVGMAILSVNGVPMAGRTPSKVIKALSMAQDAGKLSLVAGHFTLPGGEKRRRTISSSKLPKIQEDSPATTLCESESIEMQLNEERDGSKPPSSTSSTSSRPRRRSGTPKFEMPVRYSRLHTIVTKKTKEDVFGITFRKSARDAPLIIKSFANNGKFQGSELCPGMVVMKVNEKDATWMTPREAVQELQQAEPGEVSLTTEGYTGRAYKESTSDSLGLFVTNSNTREGVFIVGIESNSQLSRSDLRVGMQVILINGKPCPTTAEDAIDLLEEIRGQVTILATLAFLERDKITVSDMTTGDLEEEEEDGDGKTMNGVVKEVDQQKSNMPKPKEEEVMVLRKLPSRRYRSQEVLLSSPTASCFGSLPTTITKDPKKQRSEIVHISLQKELRKTKPGIVLTRKKDYLVVKQIRENSWFSKTALEPGMVLLAIDNKSIVQKDVEHIFLLFQEARKSGRMLLTARKGQHGQHQEDNRLSRIQAIAYKKSPDVPIGITFSRADSTSPLIIHKISNQGIMSDTMLRPGMVVLQINGRRASWLSPTEASAALRHAPTGRISITAEGFHATGHKSRRNEGYGLIVKNSSSREGLFISHIKENSPFAFSSLKPGMQILLINGKPCPSTLKATGKLLRKCGEKVDILATSAFQEGFKVTVDDLASRQEGPFLDNYFQCFVFDF